MDSPVTHRIGPSKQFLIRGGIAIGLIATILIVQTTWFRALFHKKPLTPTKTVLLGTVISKDSNGNGIPDWEEKLWGLDPTVLYTGGISNAEIIAQKRLAAGIKNNADNRPLDETDQLSRSLFSLTAAVGDSDQADSGAIQTAAQHMGESVAIETVNNHYSIKDIHIVKSSPQSIASYQKNYIAILKKYDTGSSGLDIVVQALQTGDFSQLPQLTAIADQYHQIAQELSKIPVPTGAASYHLDIINGFYGIADSFQYLSKIEDNSIVGLSGIVAYRKFNTSFQTALTNLNIYFTQYGILSS